MKSVRPYIRKFVAALCALTFFAAQATAGMLVNPYIFAAAGGVTPTFISATHAEQNGVATGSAATFSHTTTAATDILIVTVVTSDEDFSGVGRIPVGHVKFGTTSLTKATGSIETADGSDFSYGEIWYLANPPATTANISIMYQGFSGANTTVADAAIDAINVADANSHDAEGSDIVPASNVLSATVATTKASFIVGVATNQASTAFSYTPGTGVTELQDQAYANSTIDRVFVGYKESSGSENFAFETTMAGSPQMSVLVVAAFALDSTSQFLPILAFHGTGISDTNADSYNFSNFPPGAATPDRLMVIICYFGGTAVSQPIDTVTYLGETADIGVQTVGNGSSGGAVTLAYISDVVSDEFADTAWTCAASNTGGSPLRAASRLYSLYRVGQATPRDSDSDAATGTEDCTFILESAINTGIVIAGAVTGNATAEHTFAAPLVEGNIDSGSAEAARYASGAGIVTGSTTVTITPSASSARTCAGVAWR